MKKLKKKKCWEKSEEYESIIVGTNWLFGEKNRFVG